ncbi:MAG: EamA family transporter [Burkholderiales bacterium]|nr:EamA family transporter [Burkholderiales bacterium]
MNLASVTDFLLLAAIWGASFLFMRIGVVEFGALPTAAVRVAVAMLFLLPLMVWRGFGDDFRKHWKTVTLIGLLNSGVPFALFSFALLSITTGLSAILNATVPLFGALIAWGWLHDRPTGSRMLGLVVGFFGMAMLAWDKASIRPDATVASGVWAVLACLLASICYGFAANAAKKYLVGIPPMVAATGSQVGATAGLALPALLSWPAQMPSLQAWGSVIVLGVLCTGVAYILYFRLIEQAGPAKAVAVTFLVPVFAVIYGTLFLGEPVTAWMLGWGAVIIMGTSLATGLVKVPSLRTQA